MTQLLLAVVLSAAVPQWSQLTTDTVAALAEEGLSEQQFSRLREGEILTAERTTAKGKSGVGVVAFAIIESSPEPIFEAVANCEALPEFMPHFEECTAVEPPEPLPLNERWNENRLKFGFFPLSFEVRIVQHARLEPPLRLSWKRVSGDTETNEGYWRIIPLGERASLLVYDTLTDPGKAIPDWVQRILVESDLPGTVKAVRDRVTGAGK